MSHLTTNCCYVATMEKAGEARPKDVVEVGVGALDVVERGHDGEGVLLVEEDEGDQSAVIECNDVVVEASEAAVGGRGRLGRQ